MYGSSHSSSMTNGCYSSGWAWQRLYTWKSTCGLMWQCVLDVWSLVFFQTPLSLIPHATGLMSSSCFLVVLVVFNFLVIIRRPDLWLISMLDPIQLCWVCYCFFLICSCWICHLFFCFVSSYVVGSCLARFSYLGRVPFVLFLYILIAFGYSQLILLTGGMALDWPWA